jgi:hypothetical protein
MEPTEAERPGVDLGPVVPGRRLVYIAGELPAAVVTSVDGVLQSPVQRHEFDVGIEQRLCLRVRSRELYVSGG